MMSLRTLQASVAAGEAAEIAAGGPKTTASETREFLATSAPTKAFRENLDEEAYTQQSQEFSDLSDADVDDEDVERALAVDSPKSPPPVDDEVFKSPAKTPGGGPKEAAAETAGKVGGRSDEAAKVEPLKLKRSFSQGGGAVGMAADSAATKVKLARRAVSRGDGTPTPERALPPTAPTTTTTTTGAAVPGGAAAVSGGNRKAPAERTGDEADKNRSAKTKN